MRQNEAIFMPTLRDYSPRLAALPLTLSAGQIDNE